jgi:hypothetical protein
VLLNLQYPVRCFVNQFKHQFYQYQQANNHPHLNWTHWTQKRSQHMTNGIYSSVTQTVNQVIMATAKLSKWQLNLWFWSFHDSSNPQLSRKYWYEYKLWNIIPRYQLRDILNRPSLSISKRMAILDGGRAYRTYLKKGTPLGWFRPSLV